MLIIDLNFLVTNAVYCYVKGQYIHPEDLGEAQVFTESGFNILRIPGVYTHFGSRVLEPCQQNIKLSLNLTSG